MTSTQLKPSPPRDRSKANDPKKGGLNQGEGPWVEGAKFSTVPTGDYQKISIKNIHSYFTKRRCELSNFPMQFHMALTAKPFYLKRFGVILVVHL